MAKDWTVYVTLLGRRDGADVAGIGVAQPRGDFDSYSAAREAAESWERDPTFVFKARAHHRGEQ